MENKELESLGLEGLFGDIIEPANEGVINWIKSKIKRSKEKVDFTLPLKEAITAFETYAKDSGVVVAPLSNEGFTDEITKTISDMKKIALREDFVVIEKKLCDTLVLFAGETEDKISMVGFCQRGGAWFKFKAVDVYDIVNFKKKKK